MSTMSTKSQLIPRRAGEAQGQNEHARLCRVIVHNDDVTPMDFVIRILVSVFLVPDPNAVTIMYAAHLHGTAYVQSLPRADARRRINEAHFAARLKGYPLFFSMESE